MRLVDDRIRHVEVLLSGNQPHLYVELQDGLVLPINLLGDGAVAMARYILGAVQAGRDGVLLIDEIDNGIHWSVQPAMWKAVRVAARRLNVQVVATTHSRECITAAVDAFAKEPNIMTLFRFASPGIADQSDVTSYNQHQLRAGLELDADVR